MSDDTEPEYPPHVQAIQERLLDYIPELADVPGLGGMLHCLTRMEQIDQEMARLKQERMDWREAAGTWVMEMAHQTAHSRELAIRVMSGLYWYVDELPAGVIGAPWGVGSNRVVYEVASVVVGECACGAHLTVGSRTQLRSGFIPKICPECARAQDSAFSEAYNQRLAEERARLEQLRAMPYREYLQTPEWAERRRRKLKSAGYACQLCNAGGTLDVHHRTYKRRGNEYDKDLVVLCRDCHTKFHNELPGDQS